MTEKPETISALIAGMTPGIYQNMRTAVELGKWENGDRLTQAQLENCLQAIIAWDHMHLPEAEHVAYIDRTRLQKSQCDD